MVWSAMMKRLTCLFAFLTVVNVVTTTHAQWWGSENLPGNPGYYTYKTRFGHWQYGALERNITTSQKFADRGIIRDWRDGSIIAVDRNVSGSRFAQQGVPNLVYIPQINYFDSNYLTDTQYKNGLRQYWPEDQQLLNHEWEQITYTPERLPPRAGEATPQQTAPQNTQVANPQASPNRVQTVVLQQIPVKPAQNTQLKQSYHERVMQRHAERRATEEERNRRRAEQLAEQLAEQNRQRDELMRRSQMPVQQVEPLWFRDQIQPAQMQPLTAVGIQPGNEMSVRTYTIPANPVAEQEKRLEYALAGSPEISFYSPFQAKFENGTVTVTGVVGSEDQRQVAERILLAQPGVQRVQNHLTIAE
jgi:hypothetical protein